MQKYFSLAVSGQIPCVLCVGSR